MLTTLVLPTLVLTTRSRFALKSVIGFGVGLVAAVSVNADVVTTPTMNDGLLAAALNPTGLSIDSVMIRNGQPGQFGTCTHFIIPPVTIQGGVVMSSGDVTNVGAIPGGTSEFDAYGIAPRHILNGADLAIPLGAWGSCN
ncbi:MAG: hypothetical protein SGJ09_11585 [Phycisphaerae bacterium]|nr:hypothetical protein [Phycisphaerae bacterium]